MKTLSALLALYALSAFADVRSPSTPVSLTVRSTITEPARMPFIERSAGLALNIEDHDVKRLRTEISRVIKKPLTFFRGWDPRGEAHVTTVTPPELKKLAPYVSAEEIDRIARDSDIQASDLRVLGIGSGKKNFGGSIGDTFFIIVESKRLREIRETIFRRSVRNGGPTAGPDAFNPRSFYPHITIGFTHEDIHESDGLRKDVKHSLDERFKLRVVR